MHHYLFLLCLPLAAAPPDWMLATKAQASTVETAPREVSLANGLVRRTWRVEPNCATVAFDNLMTGASLLRAVSPEARLTLDGAEVEVGGLTGQPDYAYLRREWVETLTSPAQALRCTGYEKRPVEARLNWKRVRYASSTEWPPRGAGLVFHFEGRVAVDVHYEIYDGLPLMAKWIVVRNIGARAVRLDRFTSEILAVPDEESSVEDPPRPPSSVYFESDYAFHGMDGRTANRTVSFEPDPRYETQVNYQRRSPVLAVSRPPYGPGVTLAPGESLESFRTFELVYDSTERERNSLARRRMARTLAPWGTENPILMHVRQSDPASVRLAIDQAAETGFEMVILSFGSRFNAENADPAYLAQIKDLADYARSKGVELGGYSLLASRRVSDEHDAVNPTTGKPGGAIFGNSPCLASRWGLDYFAKLRHLFSTTGLAVLEHDGSYPGDRCASKAHPGHGGLDDSQWRQWELIRDFYRWSRERGIYLNVPDWYFLQGSSKTGMGYRETNWSLPRDRQMILARQNIYDGTWDKTPSMGWMFVPLTQYHGGGAAATLEPLSEHLDAYEQHLVQNFSAGVQACYRGPRLYDTEKTREVVRRWVSFYKAHRAILDSDVIHLRRPDGRDWDGLFHVKHGISEKGLAFLFNPLKMSIRRTIRLPLYYTGLKGAARLRVDGGPARKVTLDARGDADVPVTIPARGWTWLLVE